MLFRLRPGDRVALSVLLVIAGTLVLFSALWT